LSLIAFFLVILAIVGIYLFPYVGFSILFGIAVPIGLYFFFTKGLPKILAKRKETLDKKK